MQVTALDQLQTAQKWSILLIENRGRPQFNPSVCTWWTSPATGSSRLYKGSVDAYSRAMKLWGCRLWSSEHRTPDEFKYHNVLCIFKSKSSDYTIKPCAPLAFSNRRLEALFSLLPLLFCPITVFFNQDYFQKGFFSHTYTEQNKVHIKNFKAEIPRPKTFESVFYCLNLTEV